MRKIWSEQDEIARSVVGNSIADESLAAALDDQGQFKFGMIMPEKRELQIDALKCAERIGPRSDFFKMSPHAAYSNSVDRFAKS